MVAGDGSGGKRWRRVSERKLLDCSIFSLRERENESPEGKRGRFIFLDAPDWTVVLPLQAEDAGLSLLMVRQFRHGSDEPSVEFPGGVVERGEDPAAAAARELEEETGYRAGRLRSAGSVYPNPAFMGNRFHVFVADRLEPSGSRGLDEHEIIDAFLVPLAEVRERMGSGEYSHALMAAALLMAGPLLKEAEGRLGAEDGADGPRGAIALEPLTPEEYVAYRAYSIGELAKAIVESGRAGEAGASALAAAEQDEVLPRGEKTPGQHLYSARRGPAALGRVWFGDVPGGKEAGTAFVYDLDVEPGQRGRGLGAAILKAAESRAKALGYRAMRLYVLASNAAARALYAKAGFKRLRGDDRGEVLGKEL